MTDLSLHPAGGPRPLLVTEDPTLLDDLLRLCAVVGVEPEVQCGGTPATHAAWGSAPLVVVGDDLSARLAGQCPARRPGVILIGRDLDDGDVWRRAVAVGAEHVIFLPDAEGWLVDRLADLADGDGPGAVGVAVLGGRGGAGASTLACALAVTAARDGLAAGLIDVDPLGGGIDLLLGGERAGGLRWPDLAAARGRVDGGALSGALPKLHGLTVLSWDRGESAVVPPDAMRSVVAAVRRRHDLVVVDAPRHFDAATEEAVAQCGTALVVVPAQVRSVASAAQVVRRLRPAVRDLRLVVRGPVPPGASADEIARELRLPLAGELRSEPQLDRAVERGETPGLRPRGPLGRFCRDFLAGCLETEDRSRAA